MKFSKVLKIIVSGVVVIILGAIGSGVWSRIFAPGWDWLSDKIIRIISVVCLPLKDIIYKKAAEGFHEEHSLSLYIMFLVMIISIYAGILIAEHLLRLKSVRQNLGSFVESKKRFVIFNILVLGCIASTIFTATQATYSNNITTKSLNSIYIISPYISLKESQMLKSEFLKIKNRHDYNAFYKKMQILEKKYEIELPLFRPL